MVESCDHGFVEDSDDSSVEGSAGGSLKHLLILLLLPAVQVGWGMLVTSSSQFLLVGVAHSRTKEMMVLVIIES